jgi:hypothetical protein
MALQLHQNTAPVSASPPSGTVGGANSPQQSGSATPPAAVNHALAAKKQHFIAKTLFSHHSMDDARMPWSMRRRVRQSKQVRRLTFASKNNALDMFSLHSQTYLR